MEAQNRKIEAENHLLSGAEAALAGLSAQELKIIETKVQGALERIQSSIVSPSHITIDYQTHTGQNDKEKRKDLCSSCQTAQKCMVFVACGHSCVCEKCAEALDACPVCKREGKAIKIVFS